MTKVYYKRKNLEDRLGAIKESVGLVPTMGNLHRGHISLLEMSLKENDVSVLTIFVNPLQFGKGEDFDKYPQTFLEDLKLVEQLHKKYNKEIIVFRPEDPQEVFADHKELVKVPRFANILEGEMRPTHFAGVVTVVKRLFDIVRPQNAYFGKKDYQQLVIIKDLVRVYELPIRVKAGDIIRDTTGLALSSRNNYLSPEEKKQALLLRRVLLEVAKILDVTGLEDANNYIKDCKVQHTGLNYLEIRSVSNFGRATPEDQHLVVLGNYQVGSTRLLDNIEVSLI